ncbi:MAG: hypothetical protein ACOYN0_07580, partial [Phycisphaerales bacterium]
MKRNSVRVWFGGLAAGAICAVSSAQQAWNPVWADEFDGTQLNATNWEVMTGNGQAYNNPG